MKHNYIIKVCAPNVCQRENRKKQGQISDLAFFIAFFIAYC